MVKFKKLLSAALCAVLLVCSAVCGISASAAVTPIQATPITGWTVNRNAWQTVKSTEVYPVDNILAQGIKMSPSDSLSNGYNEVADDKICTSNNYTAFMMTEELSLSGTTGMIFYVKTDSANKVMPMITIEAGKTWQPDMALGVGRSYEYRALDADTWTTGTATAGHTNNYFGVVSFDSAFEGFVKIPYTSLTNDVVSSINTEQHTAAKFFFRVKGVGGTYGNTVVGPVMLITSDSASTKIEVPDQFKPTPIQATPITGWTVNGNAWQTVKSTEVYPVDNILAQGIQMSPSDSLSNGYNEVADDKIYTSNNYIAFMMTEELSLSGTTGMIFYVKTDSANKVMPFISIEAGKAWQPDMALGVGRSYEYRALDADTWTTGTATAGHTNNYFGVVSFDSAFEGFVKIPYTSLTNDSVASLNTEQHTAAKFFFKVKGIGGTYGNTVVGPVMLITADSPSTKIEVPDQFKPAPIEVKSVDFKDVSSPASSFSAESVQNGYSLSIDPSKLSEEEIKYVKNETDKWSYVEEEDTKIGASVLTNLVMKPTVPLAPKDSEGFIVYLKTESANALAFSLEYEKGTHWSLSYDPQMLLKPGATVSVCPTGSDTWEDKTVAIGYGTNTNIYGMITFDAPFEGYIKVPYSALNNDSGWKPYTYTTDNQDSIDRIKQIVFRFKGIGGKYGNVTVGLTGYITADSPSVKLNVGYPDYAQGDVNNDWNVNDTDFVELRKYLLEITAEVNPKSADVNKDEGSLVDIADLVALKKLIKVQ